MRFDNHENIDKVFSQRPYLSIKFQPRKDDGKDFQIKLMPQTSKWCPGITSYYVAFLEGKFVKSLSEIPATSKLEFSKINIEWTDKLEEAILFQSYEAIDILRRFKGIRWEGLQLRLSYASGCQWKPGTIDQFPAQQAIDHHEADVFTTSALTSLMTKTSSLTAENKQLRKLNSQLKQQQLEAIAILQSISPTQDQIKDVINILTVFALDGDLAAHS